MKKTSTLFLSLLTLLFLSQSVKAQDAVTFKASDLNPYLSSYFEPVATSIAFGLGGGWYTTASVHKKFGFDITFSGTYVPVPSASKFFSTSSLNMDPSYYFTNSTGSTDEGDILTAPTVSAKKDYPGLSLWKKATIGGNEVSSKLFDFPDGMGVGFGGAPALQVGFGLPFGTEIMGRFVPKVDIGSYVKDMGLWGIGIKHDLKQWIPVVKSVPFLEISASINYTKFHSTFASSDFVLSPSDFNLSDPWPAATWQNQRLEMNLSALNTDLLIGASIPVFQPYIGVGMTKAKFDGGMLGNFPIITIDQTNTSNGEMILAVDGTTLDKDPIKIKINNTAFHFIAGARVKLAVITFSYQVTVQEYMMHTAGIGFTFR